MRILVADLEGRRFSSIEDPGFRRRFIGGLGFNTYLLHRYTERKISPFDERNHLFISGGALTGTTVPSAARCEATGLSPTGYFGTSSSGGGLGAAIKFCNIDTLWLKGAAEKPVYLVIDEKGVTFKDAAGLWGKDTFETVDALKIKEGKETEVACIGAAGERGVRFSSIQNGYYHSFGRTGLGAVMGSKMLKAVCFRGKGEIQVHSKKDFTKAARKIREKVMSSDSFGYTRRYGSMVVSDVYNRLGILPGYNFRQGSFENWESTRGRRAFEEKYKVKDFACLSCPIGCLHWSKVKEGPFAGLETHGLEVTYTLEVGARLGIVEIPEIFASVELCNRLGMDVISACAVVGYVIELFEKGMISESDIGFAPRFGDFETVSRLISMIGKKEGIGELFGAGLAQAKQHFVGSETFTCEIKGLEMPVRDPRGRFDTWMLGYIINTRGGDHLRIRTPVDDLRDFERSYAYEPLSLTPAELDLVDIPRSIKDKVLGKPPVRTHIPSMAKYSEELVALLNSFGLCIRPPILRTVGPSLMAEAFNALYGYDVDEDELLAAAERIVNLQHLFNLEQGQTLAEYSFPERFYTESVGYSGGRREPLDREGVQKALLEYCALRGWDQEGNVRQDTLTKLGIETWTKE
ncbi:MAG: putative oxidoreductase YdhV [Syntrophorhabdus sp. PtaU1.Bin153]|nr:MAG: putative oxidoreductase YdhV [Syntrophorhabdus sp. PtaU1.Bin153]